MSAIVWRRFRSGWSGGSPSANVRDDSGLGGVLWYQPILPAGPGTGRVDQVAHSHVLLETVALGAHEDQEFAELGREPEDGDPAWRQQQEVSRTGNSPGD